MPVLSPAPIAVWAQRPATVITGLNAREVIDNSPPAVGVDPEALAEVLLRLPGISGAQEIVYASRLYRTALELIESRPDISYQLLISTVESLAAVALDEYEPEESAKLATALAVQQRARAYGLDEEKVKQLALDACSGQRWLKRRFKKFLLDFAPPETFSEKDRVFLVPDYLCPPAEDYSKTLGRVYDMRSGNLHVASPFPRSVAIGTSPLIRSRDLPPNLLERPEIPPVAWFERMVSKAAREYILGRVSVNSAPFVELT
jgi:hypothetical protein